jgi:Tfp pilus assembly protein PilV
MSRRTSFRARLIGEEGFSLPETIVSVMVNTMTLGVIVGMVVTMGTMYTKTMDRSQTVVQQQNTEVQFREATSFAYTLTATNSKTLTVTGTNLCLSSSWAISADSGVAVTRKGALKSDGTCDTTYVSTTYPMPKISDDTAFSFTNKSGRPLTLTAGVFGLDGSARPSAVSVNDWNSTAVGLVTLSGTTSGVAGYTRPFSFTSSLPEAGAWVGTATTAVPPYVNSSTTVVVGECTP